MIVLEGTPGAGKTTQLGALLAEHPDALIFPEAQPPPGAAHPADLEALLAEDLRRICHAAAVKSPHTIIASDRCHLGVLAYRYALTATGRAPRSVLNDGLDQARRLDLDARHHDDEVHLAIVDPALSRRRRAEFADDPRYQTWFDSDFLAAYNRFLLDLDLRVTPGPRWRADTTSASRTPPPEVDAIAPLRCDRGCSASRSPVVPVGDSCTQLYTSAVHHRAHNHAPVVCLRTAAEITAAWRARTAIHHRPNSPASAANPPRRGAHR